MYPTIGNSVRVSCSPGRRDSHTEVVSMLVVSSSHYIDTESQLAPPHHRIWTRPYYAVRIWRGACRYGSIHTCIYIMYWAYISYRTVRYAVPCRYLIEIRMKEKGVYTTLCVLGWLRHGNDTVTLLQRSIFHVNTCRETNTIWSGSSAALEWCHCSLVLYTIDIRTYEYGSIAQTIEII